VTERAALPRSLSESWRRPHFRQIFARATPISEYHWTKDS